MRPYSRYKRFTHNCDHDGDLEVRINEIANQGWRLVSVVDVMFPEMWLFFKSIYGPGS